MKIPTFDTRHNVCDRIFDCDVSIMFVEKLVKSQVIGRTQPIHSIIYYIFDLGMPSVIFRQQVGIVDDVEHAMAVLEGSELINIPISNSQQQIASSFS